MKSPAWQLPLLARRFKAYVTVQWDGQQARILAQGSASGARPIKSVTRSAQGKYEIILEPMFAFKHGSAPILIVAVNEESDPVAWHVGASDVDEIEVWLYNLEGLKETPPEPMELEDYCFSLLIFEPTDAEWIGPPEQI